MFFAEKEADVNGYPANKAGQQHSGGCYVVTADNGDAIDGSVKLTRILDSMSFTKECNQIVDRHQVRKQDT